MQPLFAKANEALYNDLASYAAVIRATIDELPKARSLCQQVLAEVRLVQALIAFGSGNEAAELSRVALQLSNLWAIREDTPARASGFSNEIAESANAIEQARRGQLIAARCGEAALRSELEICFTNIIVNLRNQQQLLEACHERLVPFRGSLELTRKRLNLLMAAAEARLPDTPERRNAVATYSTAAGLLAEWGSGLPLDERALDVLDRCLQLLTDTPDFSSAHAPEAATVLIPPHPVTLS
jgi:hypothetical protein